MFSGYQAYSSKCKHRFYCGKGEVDRVPGEYVYYGKSFHCCLVAYNASLGNLDKTTQMFTPTLSMASTLTLVNLRSPFSLGRLTNM